MSSPRPPLIPALCAAALMQMPTSAQVPARPGAVSFAEHQRVCSGKDGWSDAAPPVRVFGNVYDVGTCGIVVLLVTGPRGHILIDAATAEAASSILANIERLGFRAADVKLLLTSHEHVDHVGGMSAVQRRTGAALLARAAARPTLETGIAAAADPQRGGLPPFAGSKVVRVVRDGEVVTLGTLRLTAHATPGHAPGGMSWSWTSCEGRTCRRVVYADSVSAVSHGGYRFSDHRADLAAFRASLTKIARLPCDLLITPHPAASSLYERLAGTKPLRDPGACRAYAENGREKLQQRVASEAAVRRQ